MVTGQAPLLEVGRTGAAGYVTGDEIANLPISGRDFVQFALLKPTVQVDASGRLSLSGQRAVNSGLTIDGADAKSAFFGFGRGGMAREGGGALVAQESVQEFQVVTSGYSAEAGRSGGGAMNVVTKSGTNDLTGSGVLFLRDDQMAARLPRSPLDAARGVPGDDARYEVDEFRRYNWGASLGGPIRRDRAHFFLSYDQTAQSQPFLRDIRGRGQYDAVLAAHPDLVSGYRPNDDGTAAADPASGRTASGRFLRETGNLILFGKLNHRASDRHALTLRYNFTDYSRVSDFVGEESRRFVESHSTVGSVVSVVGESGVNELRVQYAYDDFDRRSHLPESALQAHFRIYNPSFGSFGKPWWLPVTNDERKLEVQDRFSFLSGNHELRAGFTLSHDLLSEFFAGNADGSYDFDTLHDFADGNPARAVIFFGSLEDPNFVVSQQILGAYAQDRARRVSVMRLYRICHADHLGNHHGLGVGYRRGGRWNEPGIPVLYFAATAGVAMLEMANYLPSPRLVPPEYRLGVYEVAGNPSAERWTTEDLPTDWNRFPYPRSTQRMGSGWLTRGSASLLVLPSAAVPGGLDDIVLATPARLDAASIRLSAVHERLYNPRALQARAGRSSGRHDGNRRSSARGGLAVATRNARDSGRKRRVAEMPRHDVQTGRVTWMQSG